MSGKVDDEGKKGKDDGLLFGSAQLSRRQKGALKKEKLAEDFLKCFYGMKS